MTTEQRTAYDAARYLRNRDKMLREAALHNAIRRGKYKIPFPFDRRQYDRDRYLLRKQAVL